MRETQSSISFLLFILGLSHFLQVACGGKVVNLTDENYVSVTKDDKILLVRFYAPWCQHSKKLGQYFQEVADELESQGRDDVMIAEVDCFVDETENLCDSNDITLYPVIKYGSAQFLRTYFLGALPTEGILAFLNAEDGTGIRYTCSPSHIEACTREDVDALEKYLVMDDDELQKQLSKLTAEFDEMDNKFEEVDEEEFGKKRKAYKESHKAEKQLIKDSNDYSIMKSVFKLKGLKKDTNHDEL